jgi:hypothetical protein
MRRRSHPISYDAVMRPPARPAPVDVRVTDHAILRWLERVHGIDMEFFRNQVREIAGPAAAVGASALRRDGFTYVISPTGTVVSVVPDDR